ncbi:MAG TPA: hypothetical protein DCZ10_19645 [Pelotomaculum sp.]|nr:hypothetical protein [Pelotomaculum sp.]
MVADGLKNRQHYGVTIDKEVLLKFRELADKTRIPQSKLMDEAIEDLLKKYSDKGEGR